MKKIISIFMTMLILFSSLQGVAFAEEHSEQAIQKANVMGVLYDWKFGEVASDGSVHWQANDPINAVFGYRGQTFDLGWLLSTQKYQGLQPKLIRFAPVKQIDDTSIEHFDMQDAMSVSPQENFWFLNDLVERNCSIFIKKYYARRYQPVTYRNVKLNDSGKITYEYTGNYNVDNLIEPTTAVDIVKKVRVKAVNGKIKGNDLLDEFWKYVGDKANFRKNYSGEYQKLMNNFENKTFDVDKIRFYLKLQPHVANLEFREVNDLAVTDIIAGNLPACKKVDINVQVANFSKKAHSSVVDLYFGSKKIGQKAVTLQAGEKKRFNVKLQMPCKKLNTTFTAHINPSRKIIENNYKNNKKTVNVHVIMTKPKVTGDCVESFSWVEAVPHTVCTSNKTGGSSCYTYYTYHGYNAKLLTYYIIKDDRSGLKKADWTLNDNGHVKNWIRAGYGMKVTGMAKVKVTQISGHPKSPSATIHQPTGVSLTTSWDMINGRRLNQNQEKTLELVYDGLNFMLPTNKKNKEIIYTNVDLSDGEKIMEIDIKGAGVTTEGRTQNLCKTLQAGINIKGDMYDDKRTR